MVESVKPLIPAPPCPIESVACRRQVTAMVVAGALVGACLVGLASHPRVISWPMTTDPDCLDRVAAGVNVNTAPWPALAQLPGIGKSLARRIVAHRELRRADVGATWRFQTAGDMQSVRGIGPKTVRRIAPFIRFDEVESTYRRETK